MAYFPGVERSRGPRWYRDAGGADLAQAGQLAPPFPRFGLDRTAATEALPRIADGTATAADAQALTSAVTGAAEAALHTAAGALEGTEVGGVQLDVALVWAQRHGRAI